MKATKKNNVLNNQIRFKLAQVLADFCKTHDKGNFKSWEDAIRFFSHKLENTQLTKSNLLGALDMAGLGDYKMVASEGVSLMSKMFNQLQEMRQEITQLQARVATLEEALK